LCEQNKNFSTEEVRPFKKRKITSSLSALRALLENRHQSMIAFVSTSRSSSLSSTIQTTTRERKRVLSSAFATSSQRCSRSNYSLAKRREEAFKPRSSSSSSSSRTATTSEEHNKNTMTPIQLQDVARKHFENRERTRAQMVRLFYARALNDFFSRWGESDSAFFSLFVPILFETHRWNDAWKSFARGTLNRRTERRRPLTNQRRIFLAVG